MQIMYLKRGGFKITKRPKIVITHQTPQEPRFFSTSGHQLFPQLLL